MPIPMTTRMYYRVHCLLHLIEVMYLIEQWLMIHSSNMRIERTEQDGNLWTFSMYSILAEVIKFGEVFRRDIQKGYRGVLLHLFITTLDCVGQTLSGIGERLHIVQA